MTHFIVEIQSPDGSSWDEASRYGETGTYESTRHTPPKIFSGELIALEDAFMFSREVNYGRVARVRYGDEIVVTYDHKKELKYVF